MTPEQEKRLAALLECPHSLEDFLIAHPLTVDGQLDDGWGALFPVKGREIEATVMFADISGFTARTATLNPTETLIFVNNFFAWVTAEALGRTPYIVDKYIGDEMMLVFSKEFGSEDDFADAVKTARWMTENDALSFRPHMGIAHGLVTVGFVGTARMYNCSVFGLPVAVAKRCAGERTAGRDTSIVFPSPLMARRTLDELMPRLKYQDTNGVVREGPQEWELLPSRKVTLRNLPEMEITEIASLKSWVPTQDAVSRAQASLRNLTAQGRYRAAL